MNTIITNKIKRLKRMKGGISTNGLGMFMQDIIEAG